MPSPAGFDRRLLKQVVLIVFRRTDLQIRTNHIRCLQTFQKGITFEVIILNILKKSINISSIKYEYEIIVSDSGANTLDSGASVAHSSLLIITRSPQCTVRGHRASVVFPRAPARTLASATTTIEGRGCSLEPLIFP